MCSIKAIKKVELFTSLKSRFAVFTGTRTVTVFGASVKGNNFKTASRVVTLSIHEVTSK